MNRFVSNFTTVFALLIAFLVHADASGNGPTATATKLTESSIALDLAPISIGCVTSQAFVRILRAPIGTNQFDIVTETTYPDSSAIPDFVNLSPGEYRFYAEWCWEIEKDPDDGSDVEVTAQETSQTVTLFGLQAPQSLVCTTGQDGCSGIEGGMYYDVDGFYNLDWPDTPAATTYDVQVSEAPNLNSYSDHMTAISGSELPVTNSINGQYRYRVRSCATLTECSEDWQEIDQDIVVNLRPSVPLNLDVTHNFETLDISWAPPASGNVAEYRLTETRPNGTPFETTHPTPGVTREASGLGPYEYSVRACSRLNDPDSCGESAVETEEIALTNCSVTSGTYQVQACTADLRQHTQDNAAKDISRSTNSAEVEYILNAANGAFDIGAAFLCEDNENIFRSGLLDQSAPNWQDTLVGLVDGLPTYDADALAEAEALYTCALNLSPGNEAALEGVLNVRRAIALKGNLVADVIQRNQFIGRYESAAPGTLSQTLLVGQEIALLENAIDAIDDVVSSILDLYTDTAPDGPGAVLRGDITLTGSLVVRDIVRTFLSSLSRIAEFESALSNARIDQNFYSDAGTTSRDSILDRLENTQAGLTVAMQLIGPFITEVTFDLPGPGDSNSTLEELTNQAAFFEVNRAIGKLDDLTNLLRQGYTPFGFVPDFVPFIQSAAQTNNLHTFNEMKALADNAVGDLRSKEATICGACDGNVGGILAQLRQFASSEGQFEDRLDTLETTYQQRLKTLVGDVVFEGNIEADIFTFLHPDVDLDGDGVTERDEKRIELSQLGYDFSSGNKGQIGRQYQVIETAELRADGALDQMNDLVERMELLEAEARELADLDLDTAEYIFERITVDGNRVSLLIQQRGQLQQAAADRAARKAKRRALVSSFLSVAVSLAASTVNPTAVVGAVGKVASAATSSSRSGSVAGEVGMIDAQINDIKTLQQADIRIASAAASAEARLIKASYSMYNLALSQNNLALSYAVAQRDIDREINALGRQNAEVASLLADLARTQALLERNNNNVIVGWESVDVRDTLSDSIVKTDQALQRAKVWTYVAIKALDYYANLPPNESTGQPDGVLLDLYQRVYLARRSEELAYISDRMNELATTDLVFSVDTTSCESQAKLSLKNDVFATHPIFYDPVTGDETGSADTGVFEYYSSHEGMTFTGDEARTVLFRDEIRRNLRGDLDENGNLINRTLEIRFGTNLFPPPPDSAEFRAINPYYLKSSKTAKILGFQNPNCGGNASVQGIRIDFRTATGFSDPATAAQVLAPAVKIYQEGNSYLKHTGWEASDFVDPSSQTQLRDPLANLTVYTAYEQLLPTWLIGDINTGSVLTDSTIGSAVSDTIFGLIGGSTNGGGGTKRSLAFSDRSVANDAWRIVIEESDATNDQFFSALQNMLDAPPGAIPQFLLDIQLEIGWASRNGGLLQNAPASEQ